MSNVTSMNYIFSNSKRVNNSLYTNINLAINLPVNEQLCDITYAFYSSASSFTQGQSGGVNFSFNGKGSAAYLFQEYGGYQNNTSYHPNTYVSNLNLPYVTNLSYAFNYNSYLTGISFLTTGPNLLNTSYMFSNCTRLVNVPAFDTSGVIDAKYMFQNCSSLIEAPALDFSGMSSSASCGSSNNPLYNIFYGCSNLEQVHFRNIRVSFDILQSTKFTREALLEIIGNLVDVGAERTLHMGDTNKAKLTAEDIALATAKGWSII